MLRQVILASIVSATLAAPSGGGDDPSSRRGLAFAGWPRVLRPDVDRPASVPGGGPVASLHRSIFPLHPAMPGAASMPDRAHPRGPHRRGFRPFGSVHNGLESGIGYGYPTLYPLGGGSPYALHLHQPRR